MRPVIYLACPYSHPDFLVREERFEAANRAAARLAEAGYAVFSPISMSHPMEMHMAQMHDSAWWCAFDEAFMAFCDEISVLMIDGWETSKGVAHEIAWFKARGRPVRFMEAPDASFPASPSPETDGRCGLHDGGGPDVPAALGDAVVGGPLLDRQRIVRPV